MKERKQRRILEPGERFSRWTVKEYLGSSPSYEGSKNLIRKYLCVCDCGREKVVRGTDLVRGKTRSCGCLRWNTRKERASARKPAARVPKPYVPDDIDQFTDDWMFGDKKLGGSPKRRKRG